MLANAPYVKTITKCKRCGKERAKIVSKSIWDGIAAQLKAPIAPAPAAPAPTPAPAPPPAPAPTPAAAYVAPTYIAPAQYVAPPPPPAPTSVRCFSCGSPVPTTAKICPKCKIELICDKCGTRIYPGAKFCQRCGDKVERFAAQVPAPAPPPSSAKTITCPSCQEQNSLDSAFCAVCGQELICDKCHRLLREGASFCNFCGDPVTKGKFSV
jgi:RNA polymerase subunit RPABC4/transcription elongation factor Spt4